MTKIVIEHIKVSDLPQEWAEQLNLDPISSSPFGSKPKPKTGRSK